MSGEHAGFMKKEHEGNEEDKSLHSFFLNFVALRDLRVPLTLA